MKIIKQGSLPEDKVLTADCGHCKSKLEFTVGETRSSPDPRDQRGASLRVITCPVCEREVYTQS